MKSDAVIRARATVAAGFPPTFPILVRSSGRALRQPLSVATNGRFLHNFHTHRQQIGSGYPDQESAPCRLTVTIAAVSYLHWREVPAVDRSARPLALTAEAPLGAEDRRSLDADDVWRIGWIAAPDVEEAPLRSANELGQRPDGGIQ